MKKTTELIDRITNALDTHTKHNTLSDWGVGFCESLLDQLDRGRRLSEKQVSTLAKIERKCTAEAIETSIHWGQIYKEKHRADALVCATYYKSAGYFVGLALRILEDDTFVPPRQAFEKMTGNKFAQKVLATSKATPKYPVGTDVEFRRPALGYRTRHLEGTPCLVVEVLSEVASAANGAKQYSILPYGALKPLVVEERHIKKCRYKKAVKKDEEIPF